MDADKGSQSFDCDTSAESARPDFLLTKWYMDCITPAGDAFVGYAATLSWKAIRLRYYATMVHRRNAPSESRSSLRTRSMPVAADGRATWHHHPLKVAAAWTATADPIERVIYHCREGHIRWSCLMPRADAVVEFPGSSRQPFRGTGYLERLEMTVLPWRLPLETLRWGRFHSSRETVIWIDMQGGLSNRLVFVDGTGVVFKTVADDLLESASAGERLELDRGVTLRRGAIGTGALKLGSPIRRIVPVSFLKLREHKWISRGILTVGGRTEEGLAIHEVVRWPRQGKEDVQ
jgi:hypothetical protein